MAIDLTERVPEVVRMCACGNPAAYQRTRCRQCKVIERECTGCGRTFKGTTIQCEICRAIDRTCKCGRRFYSKEPRCWSCRTTPRICECGNNYTGTHIQCEPCRKFASRALKRSMETAGPISRKTYKKIRNSGPCVYCGSKAEHIDHVWPLDKGGPEHVDNLVPACGRCNNSKGRGLLTNWLPERIAYGIAHSPIVAAEYVRLTGKTK